MSAAGALRYQVQATWRPSGATSALPMTGRARSASMAAGGTGASELRALDDHRLVARRGEKFLEGGQLPHRIGIGLRHLVQLDAISAGAADEGRVHGIGRAEGG